MVLQVLYENIKDKTKILTKKQVKKVDLTDDGVLVTTSDKSTYKGDILVGADGIHSSVRGEMWRIANEMSPGWIPVDEHSGEFTSLDECEGYTDLTQLSLVIMAVFLEYLILAMVLSPAPPIRCSKSINRMFSTVVLKVESIGSISTN